jgi:hypothetical protein
MKKGTRLMIGPVAVLVVLALLTVLVVKRQHLTAEEAGADAVQAAVKLEERVLRDRHGSVAFLALLALFGFVTWRALRANPGEDKAVPPAGESGAGDTTTFRSTSRGGRAGPIRSYRHSKSAMYTSPTKEDGVSVSFAGIVLGCGALLGFLVWNVLLPRPSNFLPDLLTNALWFGGVAFGAWLYNVGRRMGQMSAADATTKDTRPPILLLRSFKDDHALRVRRSGLLAMFGVTALMGKHVGFEEILVKVLAAFGPVLAIGRPGEWLPPVGAARAYLPEGTDWKEEVDALAKKSAWIVMVLGASEGFRWELNMVLGLGRPEKLVIVLPPLFDKFLRPRWEALRQEFRGHGRELPPAFDPETVLVGFSEQWEPVFSIGHGLERAINLERASIWPQSTGTKQYEEYLRHALAGIVERSRPPTPPGAVSS